MTPGAECPDSSPAIGTRWLTGQGPETLLAGSGNDLLVAGPGANSLVGGSGNDTLVSNGGDDTLVGGTGNDVFRINPGPDPLVIGRRAGPIRSTSRSPPRRSRSTSAGIRPESRPSIPRTTMVTLDGKFDIYIASANGDNVTPTTATT